MEKALQLEEIVSQIALCFPPSEPQHLIRAAQISKIWQRVLSSRAFRRSYFSRYPNPPLLGYFNSTNLQFVPLCSKAPICPPACGTEKWSVLDSRNGRVLVHCTVADLMAVEPYYLMVWNPATGDQELLPVPPRAYQYFSGAILCRTPGCNHVHCESYLVVFVGCDTDEDDEDSDIIWASTYCSATGQWSELVKLERQGGYRRFTHKVDMTPPLHVHDSLYFNLDWDDDNDEGFIKFQLDQRKLSLIEHVPVEDFDERLGVKITSPEGGCGLATREGNDITFWSLRENPNEPPEWIPSESTISAENCIPLKPDSLDLIASLDTSTIFVANGVSLFTLNLATLEAKEVGKQPVDAVIPFMTYVMPRGASPALGSASRATEHWELKK